MLWLIDTFVLPLTFLLPLAVLYGIGHAIADVVIWLRDRR